MWILGVFLRLGAALFLGAAVFLGCAGAILWLRGGAPPEASRGVLWTGAASLAAFAVLRLLGRKLGAMDAGARSSRPRR